MLVDIDAGASHTCALASNGIAYCWGNNTNGELGVCNCVAYIAPTMVGIACTPISTSTPTTTRTATVTNTRTATNTATSTNTMTATNTATVTRTRTATRTPRQ